MFIYTKRYGCKRHDWRLPEVGDTALNCEACGRLLPLSQLAREPYRLRSIACSMSRNIRSGIVWRRRLAIVMNHWLRTETCPPPPLTRT